MIYRIRAGTAADGNVQSSLSDQPSSPRATANPLAALAPAERASLVARGEALFASNACGTCHRADQAATGVVVKPLETLALRYDLDSLTRFFLTPTPPMPVTDLPEADRRAIAIYLLDQHP